MPYGDRQEVEALVGKWFDALRSGKVAEVMALYADSAVLLSTLKGKVMDTRQDISDYFEHSFLQVRPDGNLEGKTYPRLYGDIATHSGLYKFVVDAPPATPVIQLDVNGSVTLDTQKY